MDRLIYVCIYIYTSLYIEREREMDGWMDGCIHRQVGR